MQTRQIMADDFVRANRRRRTGLKPPLAVLAMITVLMSGSVWAAEEELNNGQDPTRPLTRFDQAGISIPFPQRSVHVYNTVVPAEFDYTDSPTAIAASPHTLGGTRSTANP